VRRLPGNLVEAAEPAAEARGDCAPVRPQLGEPPGVGDDEEVDVRPLVRLPARQRALE